MKSEFKQIPGYENYEISKDGTVRNIKNKRPRKPYKELNGYISIVLRKDKKSHKELIHRLVFEAFNGSIDQALEIDHIDGNRSNNCFNNLQQITAKENRAKRTKARTRKKRTRLDELIVKISLLSGKSIYYIEKHLNYPYLFIKRVQKEISLNEVAS